VPPQIFTSPPRHQLLYEARHFLRVVWNAIVRRVCGDLSAFFPRAAAVCSALPTHINGVVSYKTLLGKGEGIMPRTFFNTSLCRWWVVASAKQEAGEAPRTFAFASAGHVAP
jgi:hypothetical protein